jgi:hypothetical protein
MGAKYRLCWTEWAIQRAVEVIKPACDYAAKKGVILGIQNQGGITSKASNILEILKRVDSPYGKCNLDIPTLMRTRIRRSKRVFLTPRTFTFAMIAESEKNPSTYSVFGRCSQRLGIKAACPSSTIRYSSSLLQSLGLLDAQSQKLLRGLSVRDNGLPEIMRVLNIYFC